LDIKKLLQLLEKHPDIHNIVRGISSEEQMAQLLIEKISKKNNTIST
jgi:hypothetical protein